MDLRFALVVMIPLAIVAATGPAFADPACVSTTRCEADILAVGSLGANCRNELLWFGPEDESGFSFCVGADIDPTCIQATTVACGDVPAWSIFTIFFLAGNASDLAEAATPDELPPVEDVVLAREVGPVMMEASVDMGDRDGPCVAFPGSTQCALDVGSMPALRGASIGVRVLLP